MAGHKTRTHFQDIPVVVHEVIQACNQVKVDQFVAIVAVGGIVGAAENIRIRRTTQTLDSIVTVRDSRVGRCRRGTQEDREV